MKCLVGLTLLLICELVLTSPVPRDNANSQDGRWVMVPDTNGFLHLVDLESYEEPVEPLFEPENDMRFLLFTRQNPTVAQEITFDLAVLDASNFNSNNPTHFTAHGWGGSGDAASNTLVRDAFLSIGDFNIISVDWSGANSINYITSRNHVPAAGTHLGRYVDHLHVNGYIRLHEVQLIGISLGGQLIGFAGKAIFSGRVGVIISLDPAGPLFSYDDPTQRIDSSDGEYVEVIYTNAGMLGFDRPVGHANFWPNFGRSQPGCGADVGGGCAHGRSVTLHAESITQVFTGHQCVSFEEIERDECTRTGVTGRMGGPYGSRQLRGNFYLTTNGESPFTQG